uniref:Rac GTPase-activating protein 1 n=1 Tax=Takifugu rubripes TaxID=31033 RepID=A0A674P6K9_TAKRU
MEMAVLNLQGLYDEMRSQIDLLNDNIEPNFIQMAKNFDHCRRRWASTEQELGSCKEVLTKTETERGALEVKLKHARNQVDIEIRRRQKAETECEKLDRQIQLIRDLLTSEGSSNSIQLSAEQRSALGFLNTNYQAAGNLNTSRRLTRIDESASILSDISYDKTEDSIVSLFLGFKKTLFYKRSSRNQVDGPPCASKRSRSIGRTTDGVNESLVAKTTVSVPVNGGPVEAIATIETIPYWTRSRRKTGKLFMRADARTQPSTPQRQGGVRLHEFVSKTVIKPESCVPCGKRIKFGKISLKCRECRVVSHPECRERCPLPCIPNPIATPVKIGEGVLADYVSSTAPMIPALVVHCINEIENRGLHETGLYRLSGADRQVKELKEKFLRCKTVPVLSKVDDIHVITGVLKDFLRNLKEPLLTFSLNRPFMEAAEISDDDNSIAQMYQTIGDLPLPNRDTLAYLIIHLQKVANSTETRMDAGNLARVFGPTIVGHSVSNPDPMTILQDTKRQPQVVERLLSMPVDYWSQFVNTENVSLLGPLTTPEHQFNKTPSSSSLSQRMRSTLTPRFGSKSKSAVGFSHQGKFFSSPHII